VANEGSDQAIEEEEKIVEESEVWARGDEQIQRGGDCSISSTEGQEEF
jgi:hypothetical protein